MSNQPTDQFNPAADPIPDEAEFRQSSVDKDRSWSANVKRTYDAYQDLDLSVARSVKGHFDDVQNISTQALQNAVETANLVGKQAVRHGDLAIDRQWNVDEQSNMAAIIAKTLDNSTYLRSADAATIAALVQGIVTGIRGA